MTEPRSPEPLDQLQTERPNPRTADLDRLDTLGILERLSDEDQLVAPAVRAALPGLARAVDLASERWRRGGRVVLFGAGTSGRLALLDAAELGPTYGVPPDRYFARLAGGPAAMLAAVEGAEDDRSAGEAAAADLTADDLAFGISASGRTPWVIGALAIARRRGAATVGLACVPEPALAPHADVVLVVDTGPEAIAGSTRMKAGTAQKLVLNAFSTTLMVKLGKVYANLMVDVRATNRKLRRRATRLIEQAAEVDTANAECALDDAAGEVKTAIARLRLRSSTADARERLRRADGNLRRALGEP
jgi:N-acetylmuramic acid 6-phosphate etherase